MNKDKMRSSTALLHLDWCPALNHVSSWHCMSHCVCSSVRLAGQQANASTFKTQHLLHASYARAHPLEFTTSKQLPSQRGLIACKQRTSHNEPSRDRNEPILVLKTYIPSDRQENMAWQAAGSAISYVGGVKDVVQLQKDLSRKYRNVGSQVNDIWRDFTPKQRETAMRESTGDGVALRDSRDPSLGNLFHFIDEYNLKDMTSGPDHFLDLFKFRATTDLHNQVYMDDGPHSEDMMKHYGLRHRDHHSTKQAFMVFLDGARYGETFESTDPNASFAATHPVLANSGICFLESVGQLILIRQHYLLQFLNYLVEEILDLGSDTRTQKAPHRKRDATFALTNALSMMRLQPLPQKMSHADVLAQALEQKLSLEEYLDLLRTEPAVLNFGVESAYYSRPELVPDEKGRILPAFSDEYLSVALFDVVTSAVYGIAIWDYIVRLLHLLDKFNDKAKRHIILDELANACLLEYRRAQAAFKRQMSKPFIFTSKRFQRISAVEDMNAPKIKIKGRPSDWTVNDPQVHYILQLCHPDTNARQAADWIKKLDEHNARFEDDQARLDENETTALADLAVIVSFLQAMSTTIPLNPSGKKAQRFVSRSAELITELNQLKRKADFGDHVVPMGNLLEPGKSTAALQALDDFVVEHTGEKLDLLFHYLGEESLADLEETYFLAKTKAASAENATTYVPLQDQISPSCDVQHGTRATKVKTRKRPQQFDIPSPSIQQPTSERPTPNLKVKASTAAVFDTLFLKSEARGAVAWSDFETAIADLGFSVTPKGGSVFTFNPPESIELKRSITIHRPHKSDIEGYLLLIFARRLNRVYGWDQDTFETA